MAIVLAEYFCGVRVTDLQPTLVSRATRHERRVHSTEAAGKSAIGSGAMDVVTVGGLKMEKVDLDSLAIGLNVGGAFLTTRRPAFLGPGGGACAGPAPRGPVPT